MNETHINAASIADELRSPRFTGSRFPSLFPPPTRKSEYSYGMMMSDCSRYATVFSIETPEMSRKMAERFLVFRLR